MMKDEEDDEEVDELKEIEEELKEPTEEDLELMTPVRTEGNSCKISETIQGFSIS